LPPENPDTEADRLAGAIAAHADSLRTGALGKHFRLADATFRLFARARNTIYRISSAHDWFLKLTRDGAHAPLVHERQGAAAIYSALGGHPSYNGPPVSRVSVDPAFVLTAAIPGTTLSRAFFIRSWIPGTARSLEGALTALGSLLGTLHNRARTAPDTLPATTRPFLVIGTLLERGTRDDGVTDAIRSWYHSQPRSDEGAVFQHGNFRLDNVLLSRGRLALIDFENCGTGSRYQDVSRPISELLLTRALVAFPRHRADRAMSAFLDAYAAASPVDPDSLADYLRARLARYYLETQARGFRARIGGVPVVKHKLADVVMGAMGGGFGAELLRGQS